LRARLPPATRAGAAAPLPPRGRHRGDRLRGRHGEGGAAREGAALPYAPSGLPDRQVATLEFASGTLGTLTAVMAQPRSTRRLRIFGTEGLLEGDLGAQSIELSFPDPAGGSGSTSEHEHVETGPSG